MSYNNIGLSSVRGSGTSGYVQYNVAQLRSNQQRHPSLLNEKKTNPQSRHQKNPIHNEILMHEKKRAIEADLLRLELELEENGCPRDEIDKKISEERSRRWNQIERGQREKSMTDNSYPPHSSDNIHPTRSRRYDSSLRNQINQNDKRLARVDRYKYSDKHARSSNSHEMREAQSRKNDLFAKAVGIDERNFRPGEAFEKMNSHIPDVSRQPEKRKRQSKSEDEYSTDDEERKFKRQRVENHSPPPSNTWRVKSEDLSPPNSPHRSVPTKSPQSEEELDEPRRRRRHDSDSD